MVGSWRMGFLLLDSPAMIFHPVAVLEAPTQEYFDDALQHAAH
jgi:hypothetical protein